MQEYFIGDQLRRTDDVFEQARTIMMYRFSLVFTVLFTLPFITDIVLGYNKLIVLHAFDMITILAFPFMMRYFRTLDVQMTIFFLISTVSSYAIFMMTSPMKIDLIGLSWIMFFAILAALLLRGVRRVLFSVFLPWLPLVYVFVNQQTDGALIIPCLLEPGAAEPPVFLMFLPIVLALYSMYSHTHTISVARKQITHQKNEIERKNKDITDSISYAKHLQEALLPTHDAIRNLFPTAKVFYQPKDIVAGDFYWTEKSGSKIFIAAADCTGHGVPGAMVSVVCSGALTRSVREFNKVSPGEILDKTRELVIETFGRNNTNVNDGMDISLLCIDQLTGEITWSGANNPLWICDGNDIQEIKGNKQPVGQSVKTEPFTSHTISPSKGSCIYLITDGLADQFGGPNGKKLRYKAIKQTLVSSHALTPDERHKKLVQLYRDWKGNLEQVDDICIIELTV